MGEEVRRHLEPLGQFAGRAVGCSKLVDDAETSGVAEGRVAGRRRTIITEAEFLARRESVDRVMVVRGRGDRTQIGVLEDGVLVEHYVSRETTASMAGNVYLGRVVASRVRPGGGAPLVYWDRAYRRLAL